jgi:glycerol-3-phosphate dehydrogenase
MTARYDICIIGGGIQGCGIAQASAAAGYSVLLLEKAALASATSSRSSKLIHGGLRYLESAQFGLVAQSLAERELLIKNAPELVHRVPFYIPLYKNMQRRPWQVFIGLSLYALLGKFRAHACFRRIPFDDYPKLNGIKQTDLQAVYQYWDAQTDDVKLTRALMYSATTLGAELKCHATVDRARHVKEGYQVEYTHEGTKQSISCTCLVNTTGPWITQTQSLIEPRIVGPAIELIQGTHIILKQPAPKGIYYVESPSDKRAVFIMPWYGQTLVGTTETVFTGDPAEIKPTEHEIEYLRGIARHYFPKCDDTVVEAFAGARVLPKMEKSAFSRSRDTIYFTDKQLPGYLAVVGGKLTGYRAASQKALHAIQHYLPKVESKANTRTVAIKPAPEDFGI